MTGPSDAAAEVDDVDVAVEAAAHHRVAPAVWRRLRSAGLSDSDLASALGVLRHQQMLRHMRTLIELRSLGEVLDDAGIPWVVAKGPVAAEHLWPSADMREYHDVDVFVDRREFARALTLLTAAGYTLADRNWPAIVADTRAELALTAPHGTPVDLHWHIAVPARLRRAFALDMSGAIERRQIVAFGNGLTVPTFDPVDTVLHLAFHAAQAGGDRLMWAGDLHYALQRPGLDLDELVARAQRAGITVPIALMLDRAVCTLATPIALPHDISREGAGLWARVVERAARSRPFPILPGDPHAGGNLYAGARRGVAASVAATVRLALAARSRERALDANGPEGRVLELDVPDEFARAGYFREVQTGR